MSIGRELSTSGSEIVGVVSCLPSFFVDNNYFIEQYGQVLTEDVTRVIGVQSRYWASDGVSTRKLCISAGVRLLKGLQWDPKTIDAIVFVSQTPSYKIPATSCLIQNDLGLPTSTICIDLNYGCSAYPYGLWFANNLMTNNSFRRILLLVGDTLSQHIDKSDRATAMLFGDAGTATAIEMNTSEPRYEYKYILGADGSGEFDLMIQNSSAGAIESNYLKMNGLNVLNFTFKRVPPVIRRISEYPGYDPLNIDFYLFHQANKFLIDHLIKKLKISPEKAPSNIDKFGNTSGASIPLLLTTCLRNELLSKDLKLVFMGFGVGFSWASCVGIFRRMKFIDTIYL